MPISHGRWATWTRRSGTTSLRNDGSVALLDDFAGSHPADVVKHGSEWFVDAAAAPILVIEASERNVKVLGLEGFLIDETGIYPALSRIADFSNDTPEEANRKALALLNGEWAVAPGQADQMSSEATGRHMLAVVLDE